MTAIIQRYKMILVILAILILAVVTWLLVSGQSSDKIPLRGVFVMNTICKVKLL